MSDETDFEALRDEILADPLARWAYQENELRRSLGAIFDAERKRRRMRVSEFVKRMQTSELQALRALHHSLGGSLQLSTLCRAADLLGFELSFSLRKKVDDPASVNPVSLGSHE